MRRRCRCVQERAVSWEAGLSELRPGALRAPRGASARLGTCRTAGCGGGQEEGALRLVTQMSQQTRRGALLTVGGMAAPAGQDLEIPGSTLSAGPPRCLMSVSGHSFVRVSESSLHSKQVDLRSPSPRERCSTFSSEHLCLCPVVTRPFLLHFPFVTAVL